MATNSSSKTVELNKVTESVGSTTFFAKTLELNSVPESDSELDDVLVRGADKKIKFVPRSEFGGDSELPTFNEIMQVSGYASGDVQIYLQNDVATSVMDTNGIYLANNGSQQAVLNKQGEVGIGTMNKLFGALGLVIQNIDGTGSASIKIMPNPESDEDTQQTVYLPRNDNAAIGIKTLATQQDITIDRSLTYDNVTSKTLRIENEVDVDNSYKVIIAPEYTTYEEKSGGELKTSTIAGSYVQFPNVDYFGALNWGALSLSNPTDGGIQMNAREITRNFLAGNNPRYGFEDRPTGSYILASKDQLPVVYTDNTTTALSAMNLFTTYPTAKKGDSVQCLDITAGALIYIKSESGWVQSAVTEVT